MLQRKMLQLTNATTKDATTNECYNEEILSIKSGYQKHTDATTYDEELKEVLLLE